LLVPEQALKCRLTKILKVSHFPWRQTIKVLELERHHIKKGERILFKTRNSPRVYNSEKFVEDYVYLDGRAAEYIV